MLSLLLLAACSDGSSDSPAGKDSDTAVDSGGGDTDSGGDTSDTGGDTSDTSDTSGTVDTSDTGEGPPDDGGPESKSACQADWVEKVTEGDNTGHQAYDDDENLVAESIDNADGSTETDSAAWDAAGCQTLSIKDTYDAEGAHRRIQYEYTCDADGFAIRASVTSESPGDGAPVIEVYQMRYDNVFDTSGRLTVRTTWQIGEDLSETFISTGHFFYDENDNLTSESRDVTGDDVEDMTISYAYDDQQRLTDLRTDADADGALDSQRKYVYYGESNREYKINTMNLEDGTVLNFREFTWICPA